MSQFHPAKFYQKVIYRFTRAVVLIFFKVIWRLEVTGLENLPLKGGVLLAANHISLADPPLVAASSPRYLYFFAKEELFRIPGLGWYIRQLNAFPVKRMEHDVGAFKRAYQLLVNGQAVLLFPEGKRSKTGQLGQAKPGVGMLAYKTGVPVVPIRIMNSDRLGQYEKILVHIGKPIYTVPSENEKDQYAPFSESVLKAIADLEPNLYNETLIAKKYND